MTTGFVLVHGGHGGGWNWDGIVPLLAAPAVAVDLPARGAPSADGKTVTFRLCAESALAAADAAGFDQIVAVAHSMGGLTISALANLAPERVVHLVYVAALVPPTGTTVYDLYFRSRGLEAPPQHPDGLVRLGSAEGVRARLFDDIPDEQFASIYPRMVDEPQSLFNDPAVEPPPSIPRTYVRCARDVPVPPPMATAFIERLGPTTRVVDLDLGHGLIFTHPAEVAKILNESLPA
ncbi:MAG TPA: alpha/beta hydrolase [Acidimicrobiales bacterium]